MGPMGGQVIVSQHEKGPTGIVDHYAIAIRDFDQGEVTAALAEHGLEAQQNLDYGFYVRDPAGIPVQIMGALALHSGYLAEMATGEGKSLTACLPAVLAAWTGRPFHFVTVNDYLANRDAVEMRSFYTSCGVSVGCVIGDM